MNGYDLAADIDGKTWASLENCINESLNIVDEQAFLDRIGWSRSSADDLWSHLDQGHTVRRLLSTEQLLLAAACIDAATDLVNDWEFDIRVGFDKPDALALAALLRSHA